LLRSKHWIEQAFYVGLFSDSSVSGQEILLMWQLPVEFSWKCSVKLTVNTHKSI
jgi:hypothetical protein